MNKRKNEEENILQNYLLFCSKSLNVFVQKMPFLVLSTDVLGTYIFKSCIRISELTDLE